MRSSMKCTIRPEIKENRAPLSPTSKVCLGCHRAWDRRVTSLKRRRKATGNVQHTGSNAFFVQQTVEENRINVVEANLDTLESDSKDYAELSTERVLAYFRPHILSECLSGCQPTTKDELCAVLEQMMKRDPVGSKMAIVEDNDPDRTRVMHVVDESIRTGEAS